MNEIKTTPIAPANHEVPGVVVSSTFFPIQRKEACDGAELAESLKRLSAITPRLNQVTDAVNAAFRSVEEYLNATGIGIEESAFIGRLKISHKTVEGRDGVDYMVEVEEGLILVYARISGKYRLAVGKLTSTTGGEDGDTQVSDDPKPWDQAPREWKLLAIAALPALVEHIASTTEKLLSEAEAAQAAVAEVLGSLSTLK